MTLEELKPGGMDKLTEILESGSLKLLIAAFVLGGVYTEFRSLEKDLDILQVRLDKKIKKQNAIESRLRDLEACKH